MGTHTQVPNGSFTAPNAKTFRGTEPLTVSDDGPGSPESRIPYKPRAGQDAGLLVILGFFWPGPAGAALGNLLGLQLPFLMIIFFPRLGHLFAANFTGPSIANRRYLFPFLGCFSFKYSNNSMFLIWGE